MDDKLNNVVELFKQKQTSKDPRVVKLMDFAREIDEVIIKHLALGLNVKEASIILGHRMAEVLRLIGPEKSMMLSMIVGIILEQFKKD